MSINQHLPSPSHLSPKPSRRIGLEEEGIADLWCMWGRVGGMGRANVETGRFDGTVIIETWNNSGLNQGGSTKVGEMWPGFSLDIVWRLTIDVLVKEVKGNSKLLVWATGKMERQVEYKVYIFYPLGLVFKERFGLQMEACESLALQFKAMELYVTQESKCKCR